MNTLLTLNLHATKELLNANVVSRKNSIYVSDKKYIVKLAENMAEIDSALKLRFEVFNLELREGLASSFLTLRDEDKFDRQCDHLLVIEKATTRIIGTYRLQTFEMARQGHGFYSATEFDINRLGRKIVRKSVELGRACISSEHRNGRVLFLLWKGIAQYILQAEKRYLFGCCSVNSQNPVDGKIHLNYLQKQGYIHDKVTTGPTPGYECIPDDLEIPYQDIRELPPLMDMYLRYGAKICGTPAIDRDFKTIDFLVLLDIQELNDEITKMFF